MSIESEEAFGSGVGMSVICIALFIVGFSLGSCTARSFVDDDCYLGGTTVVMNTAYKCERIEHPKTKESQ